MKTNLILIALIFSFQLPHARQDHTSSMDNRLQWWQEARYGMFIHWGISSLAGEEISWSRNGYGAAKYDSLALRFNPKDFNADEWVKIAKDAGMKYMVLTAKHHDGFCLWDTKTTSHNIMNTPFGRDVCKELSEAGRKAGIKICWYFSLRDWKDPDCSNPETNHLFVERLKQQVTELLTNYGEISLLWYDYDGWASPIHPDDINALVFSLQPGIIVNNRSEVLTPDESHAYLGKCGHYATPEQFVGSYGEIPWETCANLSQSGQWSWKWNDKPLPLNTTIERVMRCAGGNGNLLLNVGPDSLGVIPPDFARRLKETGNWLHEHKDAFYGTSGGPYKPGVDYSSTRKGNIFYLSIYQTENRQISLPALPANVKSAIIYGGKNNGTTVSFKQTKEALIFDLPQSTSRNEPVIITITTDRDVSAIPAIAPKSMSNSLAYNSKVTASSSVNDIYMHDPTAIVDDNPNTVWIVGRKTGADPSPLFGTQFHFTQSGQDIIGKIFNEDAWLEVDLGKEMNVGRFLLQARKGNANSYMKRVKVQYANGNNWTTLASREATKADDWNEQWSEEFPSVKTSKFRIMIEEGAGYFGISEFQLF